MYYEGFGVLKNFEKFYIWNIIVEYNGNMDVSYSCKFDECSMLFVEIEVVKEKVDVIYVKI